MVMKVVDPNSANHVIKFIPRIYMTEAIVRIYNETTQEEVDVANYITTLNGYSSVTFDFDFDDTTKYQIKIFNELGTINTEDYIEILTQDESNLLAESQTNSNEVIYRGKIYPLAEETQNNKLSNDFYYYG